MTREDRSGGPGPVPVILGAALGVLVSLVAGLFVAAVLNTWLAIDWVRGIATLAVGVVVAGSLLRGVIQAARVRMRYLNKNAGTDPLTIR